MPRIVQLSDAAVFAHDIVDLELEVRECRTGRDEPLLEAVPIQFLSVQWITGSL